MFGSFKGLPKIYPSQSSEVMWANILKVKDVQTHVCTIFLRICQNLYFGTQNWKKGIVL